MTTPYADLIDLFNKMQARGMKLDENTVKSFIEFNKANPNEFRELSGRVMRGYKLYGMDDTIPAEPAQAADMPLYDAQGENGAGALAHGLSDQAVADTGGAARVSGQTDTVGGKDQADGVAQTAKDNFGRYLDDMSQNRETDWQTSNSLNGGFLAARKYYPDKTYIKISLGSGGKLQATLYSSDNNVLADLGLYDGDNLKTVQDDADRKAKGFLKEIALSNAAWSGQATQDAGTDTSQDTQKDTGTAGSQSTADTGSGKSADTDAASTGLENEPEKPSGDTGWNTVNFTGGNYYKDVKTLSDGSQIMITYGYDRKYHASIFAPDGRDLGELGAYDSRDDAKKGIDVKLDETLGYTANDQGVTIDISPDCRISIDFGADGKVHTSIKTENETVEIGTFSSMEEAKSAVNRNWNTIVNTWQQYQEKTALANAQKALDNGDYVDYYMFEESDLDDPRVVDLIIQAEQSNRNRGFPKWSVDIANWILGPERAKDADYDKTSAERKEIARRYLLESKDFKKRTSEAANGGIVPENGKLDMDLEAFSAGLLNALSFGTWNAPAFEDAASKSPEAAMLGEFAGMIPPTVKLEGAAGDVLDKYFPKLTSQLQKAEFAALLLLRLMV